MAFKELRDRWVQADKYPKGTSDRFIDLDCREKLLNDTLFDILQFPFSKEENGPNNYIDLLERRPAVIYNLAKVIVNHTSALTFGEAHAPAVRIADTDAQDDPKNIVKTHETFEQVIETLELDAVMLEAMRRGSVGSAAIVLRRLPDGTPWLDIIDGKYCTPFFDPADPRELLHLDQIYSVTAEDLRLSGYTERYDPDKIYFIKVTYTKDLRLVSLPLEQKKYEKLGEKDPDDATGQRTIAWQRDEARTYDNDFSFMGVWWIKNLEGRGRLDGECTFEAIKDITIEISYILSQIGRGYRYTADPLMVITDGALATTIDPLGGSDPDMGDGSQAMIKSPARAIRLPSGASADLLEIAADGLKGAGEHVRMLREYGLEVLSGMKSESKDEGGTQSGRALHLMHQALVWLVERFRTSYGTRAFLPVLRGVFRALQEGDLLIAGVDTSVLDPDQPLRLMWPPWTAPSGEDLKAELEALSVAAGSTNNFPVPILPLPVIAQKAAQALGISDQNRVAAEMEKQRSDNPPVTPRDQLDAQMQMKQMDVDAKAEAAKNKPSPSK